MHFELTQRCNLTQEAWFLPFGILKTDEVQYAGYLLGLN